MTTGRSSSRDGAHDSAGFLWRVGVGTLHYLVRPRPDLITATRR